MLPPIQVSLAATATVALWASVLSVVTVVTSLTWPPAALGLFLDSLCLCMMVVLLTVCTSMFYFFGLGPLS